MTEPVLSTPPAEPTVAQPSNGLRLLSVTLLGLLMLLPWWLTRQSIQAHGQYQQQVRQHLMDSWGGRQTLTGPVLVLPYVEHFTSIDTVTEPDGASRVISKNTYNTHTAVVLPQDLEIRTDLKSTPQQQGIHPLPAYRANLSLSGHFDHAQVFQNTETERDIQWDKAFVAIGLSDPQALDATPELSWDNEHPDLQPGTRLNTLLPRGFHVPLPVIDKANTNTSHEFKFNLSLRGSEGLFFSPLGNMTRIRMTAGQIQPLFNSQLLPVSQELPGEGFSAEWQIPDLVRSYPQHWELEDKTNYDLGKPTAGISLMALPQTHKQVMAAFQYAPVILAFAFVLMFVLETRHRQPLAGQGWRYGLVGSALCLFYLLLMALADYLSFLSAYTLAASLVSMGIAAYLRLVWGRTLPVVWMLAGLAALYVPVYFLLDNADPALLWGTGLMVTATALLMATHWRSGRGR